MIGQWIRITDALLTDELGWHSIKDAIELLGGDGRQRLEMHCGLFVITDPRKHERGMPGAGAKICGFCITAKDKENAA